MISSLFFILYTHLSTALGTTGGYGACACEVWPNEVEDTHCHRVVEYTRCHLSFYQLKLRRAPFIRPPDASSKCFSPAVGCLSGDAFLATMVIVTRTAIQTVLCSPRQVPLISCSVCRENVPFFCVHYSNSTGWYRGDADWSLRYKLPRRMQDSTGNVHGPWAAPVIGISTPISSFFLFPGKWVMISFLENHKKRWGSRVFALGYKYVICSVPANKIISHLSICDKRSHHISKIPKNEC